MLTALLTHALQADSKEDTPRRRGHGHKKKDESTVEMTATTTEAPRAPEPLAPEAEYADAAAAE